KFDNYTEEQQEIIMQAAEESVEAEREATLEQDEEYKQIAIDDGAEINEVDREQFKEIAEPILEDYAEEIGVEGLLQQIRDLEKNDKDSRENTNCNWCYFSLSIFWRYCFSNCYKISRNIGNLDRGSSKLFICLGRIYGRSYNG